MTVHRVRAYHDEDGLTKPPADYYLRDPNPDLTEPRRGLYRHYKGDLYVVLGMVDIGHGIDLSDFRRPAEVVSTHVAYLSVTEGTTWLRRHEDWDEPAPVPVDLTRGEVERFTLLRVRRSVPARVVLAPAEDEK